jgi:uracil DNA glycosylase
VYKRIEIRNDTLVFIKWAGCTTQFVLLTIMKKHVSFISSSGPSPPNSEFVTLGNFPSYDFIYLYNLNKKLVF